MKKGFGLRHENAQATVSLPDNARMDSSSRRPFFFPGFLRFAPWFVAAAVLVYGWLIYRHGSPFAAGADSSGYLNSARLLARGHFTTPARDVPGYPAPWHYYSHMPLGFTMRGETEMAATYPIGLPLHLVALAPVVGWEKTARVVNVLNVLAAGALLYAFGRRLGLARPWALAGVAALWLSPVWIMFTLQPMSDPLAVTWALAAVGCAWLARERASWGFATGVALGAAVLVRPANAILALPILIAIGLNVRAWLACGIGGAPFAVLLFAYNSRAYGNAFTTGYGFVGDAFAWANVLPNLAHFALWIPLLVGAPLALVALGLGSKKTAAPRVCWLLAAWIAAFVAFYASYWFAGETWWYLRFLLPAFPAVIIAGLLVLQHIAAQSRRTHALALTLLFAGFISQFVLTRQLIPTSIRDGERRYYRACAWLNENLPRNAIVASCQLSGAQFYYTAFPLLRWDQLPRDEMTKVAAGLTAAKVPLYAALFDFEEARALREHLPGRWTKLQVVDGVAVWQFTE